MSKCDYPKCQDHHGKFDSCLDEALWEMSLDDCDSLFSDESDGSSVALVTVAPAYVAWLNDRNDSPILVPFGGYLIFGASSGAVTVRYYETRHEASRIYEQLESEYYDSDEYDGE